MIRRVTVRRFKRFEEERFELPGSVILAGANNSGKSTLLQAIATWRFGLDRWMRERQPREARKRPGVAVPRAEFAAAPVREMNLLWHERLVGLARGQPRLIEIELEGGAADEAWICGLEFQYANPQLCYVRPLGARTWSPSQFGAFPPEPAEQLGVVHVPALAGLAREEPRRERGMQDLLVGAGRAGEILRNLLWEIHETGEAWEVLTGRMRGLFGIELLAPEYSPAQPYVTCEYREPAGRKPLDLTSAGTGMQQVLLLLAFLYARRASVILLDEPDAHQHVVLQRQVLREIENVAADRGGQLILATHSEVLLDATEPERVLGFFADGPRLVSDRQERDRLRGALRHVTTAELLRASASGAVLYVENESDQDILRAWAETLEHPAREFLGQGYVCWLRGSDLKLARRHFGSLRTELRDLEGLCLLDGDNRAWAGESDGQRGLAVVRWNRYEIENYLLHPEAITRFVGGRLPTRLDVERRFYQNVPRGTDLFGNHVALVRVKASTELLEPWLESVGKPVRKRDLHLLAREMRPEEIHPEVSRMLDRIALVCSRQGTGAEAEGEIQT